MALAPCAMRIDSYGNVTVRNVLADYIAYLWRCHPDEMTGTLEVGDAVISMRDIENVWKSDAWIEQLYSGFESGDMYKGPGATLKVLIDNLSILHHGENEENHC